MDPFDLLHYKNGKQMLKFLYCSNKIFSILNNKKFLFANRKLKPNPAASCHFFNLTLAHFLKYCRRKDLHERFNFSAFNLGELKYNMGYCACTAIFIYFWLGQFRKHPPTKNIALKILQSSTLSVPTGSFICQWKSIVNILDLGKTSKSLAKTGTAQIQIGQKFTTYMYCPIV